MDSIEKIVGTDQLVQKNDSILSTSMLSMRAYMKNLEKPN